MLLVTSGYRSDAEQARLFAAHPDPKWVAPPGQSLHRYGYVQGNPVNLWDAYGYAAQSGTYGKHRQQQR